ncbi:hypothetical protein L208DRAFT_1378403 [Tricholoma matsutake]|nr:hypothetical protein L208DRAFT_1378403 [Tricholoma matsutake 945]
MQPRISRRFAPKNRSLPPSSKPTASEKSSTLDSFDFHSHQSTPVTSPPPQAPAPTISTDLADLEMTQHVEPFWGDKLDAHKQKQFINFLHADSVADDWYGALDAAICANWAFVGAAFHVWWLKIALVKKMSTEYEEELLGLWLKDEELGRKETVAGRETYAYIIWADKMQKLAKGAGVKTGTTYIGKVRKMLPTIIKDKITNKHADWTVFLKAMWDVDIEYIKDEAGELRKKKDTQHAIEAHLHQLEAMPSSPTASIQWQMTQTSIGMGTSDMEEVGETVLAKQGGSIQ